MANNPADEVARVLGGSTSAAGGGGGGNSALTEQLTTITQQLQQLQTINQTQIETMQANTQAVSNNTGSKGSGESTASKAGGFLQDFLGLGISPLISGLVSLFTGGGSSTPAAPTPFIRPLSVDLTAGTGGGSTTPFAVDTGDGGLPRPVPSNSQSSTTQVTVNVQAIDSQSFLDHSDDIAQAVRQAMLTSTTLNDVIREV